MFTLILLTIMIVSSAATITIKKKRSAVDILEAIILNMMLFNVGVGCLFAFAGHAFMADRVALKIGWQTGSPFQLEVAAANLSIGVLGVLAVRFRQNFWLAASIAYAVFLSGAAVVHIREMIARGNAAEYNSGIFLFVGDLLIPIALFVLVVIHRKLRQGSASQVYT